MDNYDDELERIRKYIEERRKNNYGMDDSSNKGSGNNPLYNKETTEVLSRISRKARYEDSSNNNEIDSIYKKRVNNTITTDNSDKINKIDDIEKKYEEEKKSKKLGKRSDKLEKKGYEPFHKFNITLTISMILFFMFMIFYIISTHSTLLIKKPIGTISLVISIISFIGILLSIIFKIRCRDLSHSNHKFNVKLTIAGIITSLLMLILIPVLNILRFWEYMDFVIAHKKMTALFIFAVVFILFVIYIIRVIMHKRFKTNTRRVFLTFFLICYR